MQYTRIMPVHVAPRPGRNEPCPCGSGRKYKHCCLAKDEALAAEARAKATAEASAGADDAPASAAPPKPRKPQTAQPWRNVTSRGFVPAARTPRKVGGG